MRVVRLDSWHKIAAMFRVGVSELVVILMTVGFVLSGNIRRKLGIPILTFERTSDIIHAIGIVTVLLVLVLIHA